MKLVFFVHSHYHLLETVRRVPQYEPSFIIISDITSNYREVKERLEYFNKNLRVVIIYESFYYNGSSVNKFLSLLNYAYIFLLVIFLRLSKFNFLIYNDATLAGFILRLSKSRYNLSEDSYNYFYRISNDIDQIFNEAQKERFKKTIIKDSTRLEIFKKYGTSKYVEKIEVSNYFEFPYSNFESKLLIKNTSKNLRHYNSFFLLNLIFIYKEAFRELQSLPAGNYTMLITQPFFDELEIPNLVNCIINDYLRIGNRFIIKPHPRDSICNYDNILSNSDHDIIILKSVFPVELIELINHVNIEKLLSINSSTYFSNNKSIEHINLGFGYIEKFRRG